MRELLGIVSNTDESYNFCISNPSKNQDKDTEMHMGQVFAILVPKDSISAKYRGYPLRMPVFQYSEKSETGSEVNAVDANISSDVRNKATKNDQIVISEKECFEMDDNLLDMEEKTFYVIRCKRGSLRHKAEIEDCVMHSLLFEDQYN